jgi:ferric-dicitrate binding protein FerR (iron transport regulator)
MKIVEESFNYIFSRDKFNAKKLKREFDDDSLKKFVLTSLSINKVKANSIGNSFITDDLSTLLNRINKSKMKTRKNILMHVIKYVAIVLLTFGVSIYLMRREVNVQLVDINKEVLYSTYKTSEGEKSTLKLIDGSVITLKSNSEIRVPSDFSEANRKIYLEGEAFFEVHHDTNSIFSLWADKYKISVLGTKFNVRAYKNENLLTTTLQEGKVEADFSAFTNQEDRVLMNVYEKIFYNKKTNKKKIASFNKSINISWKDNKFDFHNKTFSELLEVLSLYFNKEIVVEEKSLLNKKISGEFYDKDLMEILYTLKTITPFEVEKVGVNKLVLKKQKYQRIIKKGNNKII